MINSLLGRKTQENSAARQAYIKRKELTSVENELVDNRIEETPQVKPQETKATDLVLQKIKNSIKSFFKKDSPNY